MKTLIYIIIIIATFPKLSIPSQLKMIQNANLVSETEIYIDNETKVRYSDLITFKFKGNIINMKKGKSKLKLNEISDPIVKEYLNKILKKYGEFEISKLIPSSVYGDTLIINKHSGKRAIIPDWSQAFQLKFTNLVPIDSIIRDLKMLSTIDYAEEPFQAYCMLEPNDELYAKGNNWAFKNIKAEEGWDITTGDSSVKIAIHDAFGNLNDNTLHEDLIGKVDSHFDKFGNHGTCVAGIVGANTNNGIGIASLGWNLHLRFYNMIYSAPEILRAISDGVDVINFSWVIQEDLPSVRDAIKTALASGVVCVAAAGNNLDGLPDTLYPAAYNFGELGQVIAVSATEWDGNNERFIDGWNYSPGNNPSADPTSSFIDIAAPGRDITMLAKNYCAGYSNGCGTSLSTPFVSALAGLILSINHSFSPVEVYNIITKTADKIGQYSYDENGWNQYLGYGRINALRALEYAKMLTDSPAAVETKIEKKHIMEPNYPNPFNPSTTIRYALSEKSNVSLKVYDALGNEVITLVNEEKQPGNYEAIFNSMNCRNNIASGVYLFRLAVNEFIYTQKGILIK